MKVLSNRNSRLLFTAIVWLLAVNLLGMQIIAGFWSSHAACKMLLLSLATGGGILFFFFFYFHKEEQILETAVSRIEACLEGDRSSRIDCDSEGEIYKLFHTVNTLAAVLNAHIESEANAREFLKDSISDISHQLKTPLAALGIYMELMQAEAGSLPETGELLSLSEQELDRMETLVQNLLKITRLDAGTIVIEKNTENISDMMNDIAGQFAYRARQEQKRIELSGDEDMTLECDRSWLTEAVRNLVKNALDHTKAGDCIRIAWKRLPDFVQIAVQDSGSGIHAEDIYHIFKRFYRSRFSQDTQGLGLGLPLTKAIVELHGGTVTVDSTLGRGSIFTIHLRETGGKT